MTTQHRQVGEQGKAARLIVIATAPVRLHGSRRGTRQCARPDLCIPDLDIPDLGQTSPALREVREHIDELDRELIALLQRRCELSTRAGLAKRAAGAPVLDPGREAELLAQRGHWAEQGGLPGDVVQAVFRQVLAMSRRVQG